MRRTALFIFVFLFLAAGATVYYFFLGGQERLFPAQESDVLVNDSAPQNRPTENMGLSVATDKAVLSPVLALDEASVWYFDALGKLYKKVLETGVESEFSLPTNALSASNQLKKILWPLSGNDFIAVYENPTGSQRLYSYYDSSGAKYTNLPANIVSLDWMPDGKRILYIWRKPDGTLELQISNPDASNYSVVRGVDKLYSLTVSPGGDRVLLSEAYGASPNKILSVNLSDIATSELLDRGRNLDVKFSPDGNKILFARINELTSTPELWLADLAAGVFENLKIVTSAEKTVWSSGSGKFFYALPKTVAAGNEAFSARTDDAIFVYDLATKNSMEILARTDTNPLDVRDLMLTRAQSRLFFRDGRDGGLYLLDLQ